MSCAPNNSFQNLAICIFLLLLFVISSLGIHSVIGGRANEVPVADACGEYSGTEGVVISLDGSASSDNVGVVSSVWSFINGEVQSLYGSKVGILF